MDLEFKEPNLPEKEGYKEEYVMFEQLPGIYVDSSKYKPAPCKGIKYKCYCNERG